MDPMANHHLLEVGLSSSLVLVPPAASSDSRTRLSLNELHGLAGRQLLTRLEMVDGGKSVVVHLVK